MSNGTGTAALLAFLAGGLSLALLILSVVSAPPDLNHLLEFASTHQKAYALFASLALLWSVFSVPFIAILGSMLGAIDHALATAAQLLTVTGILLLGFATFTSTGATLAVISAAPAPTPEIAAYQLRFWSHLGFYLTDPGLMAWGVGQLLFGWLFWRSGMLPRWANVLVIIGGAAGLLTLAVYQTAVLALLQLLCFAVWAFAVGVLLPRWSLALQRHT